MATLKISKWCKQMTPCKHDVSENGGKVQMWDAVAIVAWFIAHKQRVPSHFANEMPAEYVNLPAPPPTLLEIDNVCRDITDCHHKVQLTRPLEPADQLAEWWDGEEVETLIWSGKQIAEWCVEKKEPIPDHFKAYY
jgi:hypothetical protein